MPKCQYLCDCIFIKNIKGEPLCKILKETDFKNGCPFYCSSSEWEWSSFYERWIRKDED